MKKTTMLLAAAALAGGCGDHSYETIYDVRTSHKDDGAGTLLEATASIPKATLQELHDGQRNGAAHVAFSDVVRAESVFDHVGLGYNAHGHGPPGVNDIPHVDAHYYFISNEERESITCDGEPVPPADQIPDGVEANVNAEPFGGCVKAMGGHGALPYEKLTADMIYGYHDGKLAFVEPMIDVELLLGEEDVELEIAPPAVLHYDGAYPTRFALRYTETDIEFVMSGFTWLE